MKNVQHVNSFPNCDELIFLNINSYCHTLQISFKAQSKKKKTNMFQWSNLALASVDVKYQFFVVF